MYLFFDTETTGIPRDYKAPASDARNWPRMVQLAWLATDAEGNEQAAAEYIIRPEGFTIPREAARIHGITTERALSEGRELRAVLAEAAAALGAAGLLIAHNMTFDEKILGAEFLRCGLPNEVEAKSRACTMQASTEFCALPGRYGCKWPTLQELHQTLFHEGFVGAHRALTDVRACARCFFELRRRGIMT